MDARQTTTGDQVSDRIVLEVRDLEKHYPIRGGFGAGATAYVHAVNGVSFDIHEGETLSLVGESGCGKSTVGRTILKLVEPSGGSIKAMGVDVTMLSPKAMRPYRRHMQMVFQDPYSSLNPRMTAGEIVAEPLRIHLSLPQADIESRIAKLFDMVGLPASAAVKYAHEFSGGQRQRIAIARALALEPSLIVCDEAVSALDVSIQAQVLNLLMDLQRDLGVAFLFITHDLSVVEYLSDRVAVMYLGEIVEIGRTQDIFSHPKHPYTMALISAAPAPDPDADRSGRMLIAGEVPSPINPPSGCYFRTRCPHAMPICAEIAPAWKQFGDSHGAACHLHADT